MVDAFDPWYAFIFGRGTLTIVVVTVSVTFFPALRILAGIRTAPAGPAAVLDSVAASRLTMLRLVRRPPARTAQLSCT